MRKQVQPIHVVRRTGAGDEAVEFVLGHVGELGDAVASSVAVPVDQIARACRIHVALDVNTSIYYRICAVRTHLEDAEAGCALLGRCVVFVVCDDERLEQLGVGTVEREVLLAWSTAAHGNGQHAA